MKAELPFFQVIHVYSHEQKSVLTRVSCLDSKKYRPKEITSRLKLRITQNKKKRFQLNY